MIFQCMRQFSAESMQPTNRLQDMQERDPRRISSSTSSSAVVTGRKIGGEAGATVQSNSPDAYSSEMYQEIFGDALSASSLEPGTVTAGNEFRNTSNEVDQKSAVATEQEVGVEGRAIHQIHPTDSSNEAIPGTISASPAEAGNPATGNVLMNTANDGGKRSHVDKPPTEQPGPNNLDSENLRPYPLIRSPSSFYGETPWRLEEENSSTEAVSASQSLQPQGGGYDFLTNNPYLMSSLSKSTTPDTLDFAVHQHEILESSTAVAHVQQMNTSGGESSIKQPFVPPVRPPTHLHPAISRIKGVATSVAKRTGLSDRPTLDNPHNSAQKHPESDTPAEETQSFPTSEDKNLPHSPTEGSLADQESSYTGQLSTSRPGSSVSNTVFGAELGTFNSGGTGFRRAEPAAGFRHPYVLVIDEPLAAGSDVVDESSQDKYGQDHGMKNDQEPGERSGGGSEAASLLSKDRLFVIDPLPTNIEGPGEWLGEVAHIHLTNTLQAKHIAHVQLLDLHGPKAMSKRSRQFPTTNLMKAPWIHGCRAIVKRLA
jgi:hypothetical protein